MKLEKAENYGLVELNMVEQQDLSGGLAFWATVGAGILVATAGAAVVEIVNDWEHFKDGVSAAV